MPLLLHLPRDNAGREGGRREAEATGEKRFLKRADTFSLRSWKRESCDFMSSKPTLPKLWYRRGRGL